MDLVTGDANEQIGKTNLASIQWHMECMSLCHTQATPGCDEVTQMYVCAYKNMITLRSELDLHFVLLYKCVQTGFRSQTELPPLLAKHPYSFLYSLRQMQSLLAVSKSELKVRVPQTGRSLLKNIRMLHNLLCTMLQSPSDLMWVCNVTDISLMQQNPEYIMFRRIMRRLRFIYTNLNRIVHIIA